MVLALDIWFDDDKQDTNYKWMQAEKRADKLEEKLKKLLEEKEWFRQNEIGSNPKTNKDWPKFR